MSTNIYVGNLAFSTNNADLEALFAEHGFRRLTLGDLASQGQHHPVELGRHLARQVRARAAVRVRGLPLGQRQPVAPEPVVGVNHLVGGLRLDGQLQRLDPDLGEGDLVLLTVLGASASYIAVPAAMRLALPDANPSTYLPMSLAITFPFNLLIGIPLYHQVLRWLLNG